MEADAHLRRIRRYDRARRSAHSRWRSMTSRFIQACREAQQDPEARLSRRAVARAVGMHPESLRQMEAEEGARQAEAG